MKPQEALGIKLQAAFSDAPLSTSKTWTNLTADLESWEITRGRLTPFADLLPGTLNYRLHDDDGDYDPLNTGGAHASDLDEPDDIHVRLRADPDGTEFDLGHGFVDLWEVDYRKDASQAEVQSSDLMKFMDRWAGTGPSSGGWVQQRTDERIAAVRDRVGIASAWSDIGVGSQSMIARPGPAEVNAAQEIRLAAALEAPWAAVFATRDNKIRFDAASSLALRSSFTTDQAILSTLASDLAVASVPSLRFGQHRSARRTVANGRLADGTVLTSTAGAAVDLAWSQDYSQTAGSSNAVQAALDAVVTTYGTPRYGPRQARIELLRAGALAEAVLGLELRDRVRVKHRTPAGVDIDMDAHVEHIRIVGTPDGKVTVTLGLVPAAFVDSLDPGNWLIWDTGEWDNEEWGPL